MIRTILFTALEIAHWLCPKQRKDWKLPHRAAMATETLGLGAP